MSSIPTIGIDKFFKKFQLSDGTFVNCSIYDTAGQERYESLSRSYFKRADAVLLVYDISDKNSFLHIKDWMDDINKYTDDNPIKLVVGNKNDLSDQRQVSQLDINNFKQQTGIPVMEASAKNSYKINEIMETMTRMLISKKTRIGGLNNDNNTPNEKEKIKLSDRNDKNEQNQECCSISAFI
jgi:Ras-related protein Rab-1A